MAQWVEEFHVWWPEIRVVLIHDSGTCISPLKFATKCAKEQSKTVLIITYEGVRIHQELLSALRWFYFILDEGHKIRNPDAEVTLACKQFQVKN